MIAMLEGVERHKGGGRRRVELQAAVEKQFRMFPASSARRPDALCRTGTALSRSRLQDFSETFVHCIDAGIVEWNISLVYLALGVGKTDVEGIGVAIERIIP